ncbi:MAG TPA: hypothetical protein VMY98_04505 [Anaerolineae bacterium]|nr:hypothetical protein [Anaerolineae bacterium]
MRKCRVCKEREAEWSWQPFGPAESSAETFATPGWHYRGFAVIPICDDCKDRVQMGDGVQFDYKGVTYATIDGQPHETPRVVKTQGGQ